MTGTFDRVRVVAWAVRARALVAWRVRRGGLRRPDVPAGPRVGLSHERLVRRVLGMTRAKCLVRSLVLQRFLSSNGVLVDLVVGATSPRNGFSAHAWLDRPGDDDRGHVELLRLDARGARKGAR